MLTVY
jgi:hypothetical protein